MQQSYMGELLQPVNYTNKLVIGTIGSEITDSVQAVRAFFNKIRNVCNKYYSRNNGCIFKSTYRYSTSYNKY